MPRKKTNFEHRITLRLSDPQMRHLTRLSIETGTTIPDYLRHLVVNDMQGDQQPNGKGG